jgi:hypothetical protein
LYTGTVQGEIGSHNSRLSIGKYPPLSGKENQSKL